MKRFQIFVCVFAVAMLFTTEAMAQRGGGMMRFMGGGLQLDSAMLAMKEVREELKLDEEVAKKVGDMASEVNDSLRAEMREIMMGGGDMSEVEDVLEELREEEKEIVALLNDDQKERLTQLRYQRMGNAMYSDEKVQESLGFSDDQKTAVKDAVENNQQELQDAMSEARESGDFGAARDAMRELREKLTKTLDGILTEKQKEQVVEMKGDEFEFPQRRRGRRGSRSDF